MKNQSYEVVIVEKKPLEFKIKFMNSGVIMDIPIGLFTSKVKQGFYNIVSD